MSKGKKSAKDAHPLDIPDFLDARKRGTYSEEEHQRALAVFTAKRKVTGLNGDDYSNCDPSITKAVRKGQLPKSVLEDPAAQKIYLESTRTSGATEGRPTVYRASSGGKTKNDLIADLLLRPEGCTNADAMAISGWPSVSMPYQAKVSGLILTKKKEGAITRYWATKERKGK